MDRRSVEGEVELSGLHAKLYLFEKGRDARPVHGLGEWNPRRTSRQHRGAGRTGRKDQGFAASPRSSARTISRASKPSDRCWTTTALPKTLDRSRRRENCNGMSTGWRATSRQHRSPRRRSMWTRSSGGT